MAKINRHIEIVRSDLTGQSSMGLKSCLMIEAVLAQRYQKVGITVINCLADLRRLVDVRPDLVFLGMKNLTVEDGNNQTVKKIWLTEYLDQYGLDYTGSNQSAIALDFDKPSAKQAVINAGLLTAKYFVSHPGEFQTVDSLPLGFPLFVKPPRAGGGKGIGSDSVVRDFPAYLRQVQYIYDNFESPALVEEYLPGREFSVAIMQSDENGELIAMPIELTTEQNAAGDRVLGKKIKIADTEHAARVKEPRIKHAVSSLALNVFRAIGARDYGRIDIRLDNNGRPHFMEANLIPGVAQHDFTSYFTTACLINNNIDYQAMILRIAALGFGHKLSGSLDELLPEHVPRFLIPEPASSLI